MELFRICKRYSGPNAFSEFVRQLDTRSYHLLSERGPAGLLRPFMATFGSVFKTTVKIYTD
jgi:hypothetical protein